MSDSDPLARGRALVGRRQQAGGAVGRLTDEQRARLAAAAPAECDRIRQEVRLQHVRQSLAEAVTEGRLRQADADSVLERLSHGEDAHQVGRELRGLGVLPGRTVQPSQVAATTPPVPTTTEDRGEDPVAEAETDHSPEQDQASTGVPGWVKGFGIVGILLLLLIVIMLLTGHGPGRHMQGFGQTRATEQSLQTSVLVRDWS